MPPFPGAGPIIRDLAVLQATVATLEMAAAEGMS
jgi:hypothetical protein